jgi:hypothetical protein
VKGKDSKQNQTCPLLWALYIFTDKAEPESSDALGHVRLLWKCPSSRRNNEVASVRSWLHQTKGWIPRSRSFAHRCIALFRRGNRPVPGWDVEGRCRRQAVVPRAGLGYRQVSSCPAFAHDSTCPRRSLIREQVRAIPSTGEVDQYPGLCPDRQLVVHPCLGLRARG